MFSIIVAGVGGQGSILASHIYADAAIRNSVLLGDEKLRVRLGETFGAAMRGGAVASHVKIGYNIYSPLIPEDKADVILGLEPLEAIRVGVKFLKPGGIVFLNTRKYEPVDVKTGQVEYPAIPEIIKSFENLGSRVVAFDATEMAVEAGTARAMNVVMLGALSGIEENPVPGQVLQEVIRERVPEKTISVNMKAFETGLDRARAKL